MIPIKIETQKPIPITVESIAPIQLAFTSELVQRVVTEPYEGDYTFTPGEEDQTVEIAGKTATENIIVKAVPENYGRLAWEPGTLTVY